MMGFGETMQNKTQYEKPKINFVELRTSQKVADECFNGIINKGKFYFNTVGAGYVTFTLTGNLKCNNGNGSFVVTIQGYGPDGFVPSPEQTANMQSELEAFVAANDSSAPFKGSTISTNPGTDWS